MIKLCNDVGLRVVVNVGDEPVLVTVFGVELHEPQSLFDALKRDFLVNNTFGLFVTPFLEVLDESIVFEPCYEKNALLHEGLVPSVGCTRGQR